VIGYWISEESKQRADDIVIKLVVVVLVVSLLTYIEDLEVILVPFLEKASDFIDVVPVQGF